jgi:beta-lactamase class A
MSFLYSLSEYKDLVRKRICKICRSVPGEIGVAALHIEKNQIIEFNGKKFFPMASTYKIPIAIYCLSLIDSNKLKLDQLIKFTHYDLRRFTFITDKEIKKKKELFSLRDLISRMLENSDNAASDKVLSVIGGPQAVTDWLHKQGFKNINIDRSTLNMCADFSGVSNFGGEANFSVRLYNKRLYSVPKKKKIIALKKFYDDKRDTVTPCEIVTILGLMFQKKLISNKSTKFLLERMSNCTWASHRFLKFLPKNTKIWQKTGSLEGLISDIGILELPKNKGHMVIAIFSNGSNFNVYKRELAMAHITKELYNYFLQSS